jgi:biopolymer transport protein TolR
MPRRRKREFDLELVSDINVTSLVDVMMTLLIIFIIVAPMIEQGIDVTLPTADPKRIDVSEVVSIMVTENDRIYLEGQRVTLEELEDRLSSMHAAQPETPVLVKADTDLVYGSVIDVLNAVRGAGITRLAMATKPRE